MPRRRSLACLVLTLGVASPAMAAGASRDFHVRPDGDDQGPGSAASPWRTLQRAAEGAGPGSTVTVHAGTYEGDVSFRTAGTAQAPIVFTGVPGEEVTVRGALALARGVSHLRLSRLALEGFSDWGVTLNGDNTDVELTHLVVTGGEAGVHLTWGDSGQEPREGPVSGVTLASSVIRGSQYTAVDCTPGPCDRMVFRDLEIYGAGLGGEDSFGADGLAVERGEEILVEDCHVHDNGGDGIDLNSRDRKGGVHGIVVRRNRVFRNHLNGIKLWAGGRIEDNAVWGQGLTAIVVGEHPGAFEVVDNTVAYNMWDASFGDRDYAMVAAYPSDETGRSAPIRLTLLGNVFAFNGGPAHGGPTGIYVGRGVQWVAEGGNLFWSREDEEILWARESGEVEIPRAVLARENWAGVAGPRTDDLAADPRFVAGWPDVDLRLRDDSPAPGKGARMGAPPAEREGASLPGP